MKDITDNINNNILQFYYFFIKIQKISLFDSACVARKTYVSIFQLMWEQMYFFEWCKVCLLKNISDQTLIRLFSKKIEQNYWWIKNVFQ